MNKIIVKPIIKWAGGKYKLSSEIIETTKKYLELNSFEKYVDPFVGGGGMFLAMCNQFDFREKVISDINPELINLYRKVRDNHKELGEILIEIQNEFNLIESDEGKKLFYYNIRNEFNESILREKLDVKHAALFVALNKLGFNGLYRVNGKGLFNVPFGQKKSITLIELDNLANMSELLQNTKILLGDFENTLDEASNSSIFYFDSPYRPLPGSPSFTSYTKGSFNDNDQIRLAEFCKSIHNKSAKFILSNSDPKNTDELDNFFDDLYKDFHIERIKASRAISARAKGRGKVSEILVIGD